MEKSLIFLLLISLILLINTVGFIHPFHLSISRQRHVKNALYGRRKRSGNDDDMIIDAEIVDTGAGNSYHNTYSPSKSIFDQVSSKVSDTVSSVKNFIFGKKNEDEEEDDEDYQEMPSFPAFSAQQNALSSSNEEVDGMPTFPDFNAQNQRSANGQEGFEGMDLSEELKSMLKELGVDGSSGLFGQQMGQAGLSKGGQSNGFPVGGLLGGLLGALMGGGGGGGGGNSLGGGLDGFGSIMMMGGGDHSAQAKDIQTTANDLLSDKINLLQPHLPTDITYSDLLFSDPTVTSMASYFMNGRQSNQISIYYDLHARQGLPSQPLGQVQVQAVMEQGMVNLGQVVVVFSDGHGVDLMDGSSNSKGKNNKKKRSGFGGLFDLEG